MKIVITGGGGFLGSQLARRLLERGTLANEAGTQQPIEEIVLFDARFASDPTEARLRHVVGDIGRREAVSAAVGSQHQPLFSICFDGER